MTRPSPRILGIGTALAALLVPLLGATAGTAAAGSVKKHDVRTYKVEAHVYLEGGVAPGTTVHEHLSCEAGDVALDGMWKVDAYDVPDANAGRFGDLRSVRVDASYGDAGDASEWHYRFSNIGTGRAQLKTFVTCLDLKTGVRNTHTHLVQVSQRHDQAILSQPAGAAQMEHTAECGPGDVVVAPGFEVTSGGGTVFRSYPAPSLRSWTWSFLFTASSNDVTGSFRCLSTRTSPAGKRSHAHRLDAEWKPGFVGQALAVIAGHPLLGDLRANPHDALAVGAWWVDDPHHTWFLGQDARGRKRTFQFLHDGTGSNQTHVSGLSLGWRTGPQVVP